MAGDFAIAGTVVGLGVGGWLVGAHFNDTTQAEVEAARQEVAVAEANYFDVTGCQGQVLRVMYGVAPAEVLIDTERTYQQLDENCPESDDNWQVARQATQNFEEVDRSRAQLDIAESTSRYTPLEMSVYALGAMIGVPVVSAGAILALSKETHTY